MKEAGIVPARPSVMGGWYMTLSAVKPVLRDPVGAQLIPPGP